MYSHLLSFSLSLCLSVSLTHSLFVVYYFQRTRLRMFLLSDDFYSTTKTKQDAPKIIIYHPKHIQHIQHCSHSFMNFFKHQLALLLLQLEFNTKTQHECFAFFNSWLLFKETPHCVFVRTTNCVCCATIKKLNCRNL